MELGLDELKEWIRIDGDDEDLRTLSPLIIAGKSIIKESTGLEWNDVKDNEEAAELYKLTQKIIISGLYENRAGADKQSSYVISLCTQLEAYKLKQSGELNG